MKESIRAAQDEIAHNEFVTEITEIAEILGAGDEKIQELRDLRARRMPPAVLSMMEKQVMVELLKSMKPEVQNLAAAQAQVPAAGLDKDVTELLAEAGYEGPDQIREASDEDLLDIDGIGPAKLAEIRGATGPHEPPEESENPPTNLTGVVDGDLADLLIGAGFDTAESVAEASDEELLAVKGVGPATLKEIRELFNSDRTRDTPDGPEAVG